MNMPEWLEHRIGPYPVWGWILIVGAGIGLAVAVNRFRGRSGDRTSVGGDPTQGNPYAGTMATGGPGVTYAIDSSARTSSGSSRPTTNREWIAYASQRVAHDGLYQPADVDTALRRYLQGKPLSAVQLSIVNDALRLAGPPPEGAPPIERDEPIPHDGGPTDPDRWADIHVDPSTRIGIYTIDDELVRVGGDPAGGNANLRAVSEYGSAGGAPGIIDSMADWIFVENARGVQRGDVHTARLILAGSFGPVNESMKPRLRRVAEG